jgi:UDP-3-O-[3-hydroxymyristoyl] glucosamine N-acyltransferase
MRRVEWKARGKRMTVPEGTSMGDRQDFHLVVRASEIAEFLGEPLQGLDVNVEKPRPISQPATHSLFFVKKFRPDWAASLNAMQDSLVLATPEYAGHLRVSHILVSRPRLALARVLRRFFAPAPPVGDIAATAMVHPGARLGQRVSIGHYSLIGDSVDIGDDTVIAHHVVIARGSRIGRRCVIKSHAVIGEDGFGIEFDEDGRPLRLPHIGGVVLGDDVEVGALCTIARGTLGDTILEDDVKLDDHVHIAHNVRIGTRTLITACAEISGSVQVGKRVWVGPNASVNNNLKIADETLIGIGAVVLVSSERGEHLIGNPARALWADEDTEK